MTPFSFDVEAHDPGRCVAGTSLPPGIRQAPRTRRFYGCDFAGTGSYPILNVLMESYPFPATLMPHRSVSLAPGCLASPNPVLWTHRGHCFIGSQGKISERISRRVRKAQEKGELSISGEIHRHGPEKAFETGILTGQTRHIAKMSVFEPILSPFVQDDLNIEGAFRASCGSW